MQELFQTRNSKITATEIMYANGIDTFGYGELRKQLLLNKQANNRRRTNQ